MFLWHIFKVKPFAALSILACLATILACVILEKRRPSKKADRFLIGFLGLLSVYQGLRILQGAGVVTLGTGTNFNGMIEFGVTLFYLLAAGLLRLSSKDHWDADGALRLLSAAPPRVQVLNPEAERELSRLDLSTMEALNWALPHLSDGAFKLYAYLCLRHDQSTGRASFSSGDMRLKLRKSKRKLDRHLLELEHAGAVAVHREGANVGIEIVAQPRLGTDASVGNIAHPAGATTA